MVRATKLAQQSVLHADGDPHRLRRLLDLDKAHATISGDGEPFVKAEPRHVYTCGFDCLKDTRATFNLHWVAIHDHLNV